MTTNIKPGSLNPLVRSRFRDPYTWLVLLVIAAAIFLLTAYLQQWFRLQGKLGPFYYQHWLSWIGTLFIAFFTPTYAVLKRRNPGMFRTLQHIHILGNSLSFSLIAIHFAHQLTRSVGRMPDLETGLVLFIAVSLLILTGSLRYFQLGANLQSYWKFIHLGLTTTFYLVVLVHILHGLKII